MKTCLGLTAIATAIFGLTIGGAYADSKYPNRTVTLVAPGAPGGSYTIFSQFVANGLEKRLGSPFIVEPRPGAGTVIGTHYVARSKPDGYTLLMGATPGLAINVSLRKSIPYDARKDFTPVALVAESHQVLVVNADLPIHSIQDIVRIAKEKPGSLEYASSGVGTVLHLQGEMMKSILGVDIVHIPYKGISSALNDVAAGHVAMMFTSPASAGPLLQSGRVRILGTSSPKRLESLPDVPPLAEVGLPGFNASLWYLIVAPAQTPKDVVEKLHREIKDVMQEPDVRRRITDSGSVVIDSPSLTELNAFLESEITRWGKIIDSAGLSKSN